MLLGSDEIIWSHLLVIGATVDNDRVCTVYMLLTCTLRQQNKLERSWAHFFLCTLAFTVNSTKVTVNVVSLISLTVSAVCTSFLLRVPTHPHTRSVRQLEIGTELSFLTLKPN